MCKKYLTFFLLAAFGCTAAIAQTIDNKDYNIWQVQKDSSYYVFAKKGYIRTGPSVGSELIDSVTAGEKIVVKEQTAQYLTIRNIYAPWVSVVTKNNKSGYIWLGSLAINNIKFNAVNLIYGLERIEKEQSVGADDYASTKLVLQLKAIDHDSIAAMKEWKIDGGESTNFNQVMLLGDTKLQNLQNVIRISFGGEACGIATNYFYYGWTGQTLLPLPGKYSVGDADVYYHSETLLFPNENGGQAGKIIKLVEEEETIEEETETKKAKTKHSSSREVYVWNGTKAIKQK